MTDSNGSMRQMNSLLAMALKSSGLYPGRLSENRERKQNKVKSKNEK